MMFKQITVISLLLVISACGTNSRQSEVGADGQIVDITRPPVLVKTEDGLGQNTETNPNETFSLEELRKEAQEKQEEKE